MGGTKCLEKTGAIQFGVTQGYHEEVWIGGHNPNERVSEEENPWAQIPEEDVPELAT